MASTVTKYTPPGGGSSSGRTTDSDSVNLGSNPSPPAIRKRLK